MGLRQTISHRCLHLFFTLFYLVALYLLSSNILKAWWAREHPSEWKIFIQFLVVLRIYKMPHCFNGIQSWHHRYGHLNFKSLKLLAKENMVLCLFGKHVDEIHENYILGEQHRDNFFFFFFYNALFVQIPYKLGHHMFIILPSWIWKLGQFDNATPKSGF